ncbi:hypothetical protein JTE90_014632 [Oedothorax gibbosus]|uniref:C2H2-type domain-containing protein n=1 Tax=Oedothorax gibbosus TaxID=931172 RepID=A0AAV6VB00_9ARAC|nr:hypothetical protein JTE90_014632 [Oedothorax gibbosus]
MDLDDDSHLCLRCGKTVEGLDNYVSHRQQLCYKFQRPSCSPFLSDASKNLSTSAENDFPYDISKVSASDFFLSLSLQSNFKTVNPCTNLSCDVQKNVDDGFCSRLEIPVEDGELVNGFSPDKQLCPDRIVDEHNCLDINNVGLDDDKWDCFKTQNDLCSSVCYSKDTVTTNSTENLSLEQKQSAEVLATSDVKNKAKRSKKKMLKQYNFSQFSIMNNYKRTSYRQKMNANGSLMCCQGKQKILKCNLCNKMFPFAPTFIDHLLNCPKKISDTEKWREEVFRNESLLIRSLHFKCLLCSFFCGDSFEFLEHLRSSNHRQNAAYLKNPLICLPCRDECSASDEIKEHFSKTHLQYNKGDHPVIVAEKKKNVHCCYCLTLVRSSSHLEVGNNVNVAIDKDINFLKNSFHIVSGCAYGVDKSMVNSYTTKVSSVISACEAESPNITETKCSDNPEELHITSVLSEEPLKIKISKSVLKGDQNPKKLKENIIDLEEVPTENTLPPLIGKITTQNGKFIYTKLNSNKVLLCVLCGSKHVSKASLKRHMEKCDIDDKASQKSFYLKQKYKSLKKKSVKNQYLCDRCPYIGKSFNQLTRHSRSHSGEKPFKCLDCEYTFALSSQLIRHKRLHTGQKPYNCPYCKYTCNTQENLRKHILKTKKHKGKMMYPCQYCSYESNEFSTFRDHLLEDHSKQFPKGVKSLSSSVHELSLSYKN